MQQSSKFIKNLVAIGISLAVFGCFLSFTTFSFKEIYQPLLALPTPLWCLVVLGLLTTYVLRGWRVAYEFRSYESLSLFKSIKIVLWHNATLNLLPFRAGELVFPLLLHKVAQVPVLSAVTSLIYLRFQDACTVAMIAIIAWPNLEIITRILLVLALVSGAVMFQTWTKSAASWQTSPWMLKRRLAGLRDALANGNPHAGLSWLLTAANWSIKMSIQALLYVHLLHLDFSVGVLATLSSEFAALLPIQGFAGLGTFEASSAMVIRSAGISWADSFQVATQVHLIMLSSALFWAFMSMFATPLSDQKINNF
jgi:hypothetical protein